MARAVRAWLGLSAVLAFLLVCTESRAQSSASGGEGQAPERAPSPPGKAEPLDFTNETATSQQTPAPGTTPPKAAPPPVFAPPPAISAVEPAELSQPAALRANAINLSVLGFVIGNIRLTYERLLRPKHGAFAEAIVAPDVLRGFDFVEYGAGVGYRFHWRGAKTSGFVGATLSVTHGSGTRPTLKLGDEDTVDFTGSVWTFGIAPHVGKRWLFERSGVNLTLRFGGGFAYRAVDPSSGSPAEATHNVEHNFLIADGELSVGYSF